MLLLYAGVVCRPGTQHAASRRRYGREKWRISPSKILHAKIELLCVGFVLCELVLCVWCAV